MKNKLLFVIIILCLASCQEKINGCLDRYAANFLITADADCGDAKDSNCPCQYPKLTLGISYVVNAKTKTGKDTLINWNNSTKLKNAANQEYFFDSHYIYLSDFQLVKNGKSFFPTDSIALPIKETASSGVFSKKVRRDFTLLLNNSESYTIGEMKDKETYDGKNNFSKLKFKIGLQSPENQHFKGSTTIPSPSEYSNVFLDTMYQKNSFKYYDVLINYQTDITQKEKIKTIKTNASVDVEIDLPTTLKFEKGFDVRTILNFKVEECFKNVNFQTESPTQIEQKVIANLKNCFILK